MLITYLLHEDVYISAELLDNEILNKQIHKAYDIYKCIMSLKILGSYYKVSMPGNDYDLYKWIRDLVKLYIKQDLIFVLRENGEILKFTKDVNLIEQDHNQIVI